MFYINLSIIIECFALQNVCLETALLPGIPAAKSAIDNPGKIHIENLTYMLRSKVGSII